LAEPGEAIEEAVVLADLYAMLTMRPDGDPFLVAREKMVATQMAARGISSARVLEAMRSVPRHLFVPPEAHGEAYLDHPLPIGFGQTISQPYIVALMTELAWVGPDCKVLEIGTGCGYQTAVLAELAREVFSIEFVPALAERAAQTLAELGYQNVTVRAGDGHAGWPEQAPFDVILITAAPRQTPEVLLRQLAMDGRLVVPEGDQTQVLRVYTRTPQGYAVKESVGVRFVPMLGEAERL
jgi:protein-L-isoaspartate(D-aspartate) O-methyltransferase